MARDQDAPAAPRLLVDAMLGRLCKRLRLLGYDALYAASWSDHQIAAQARAQGRIVLTRDQELIRRKGLDCLLVHSQTLETQLEQIVATLGAPPPSTRPRCPRCNTALESITPEQARVHVPKYVFDTQHIFTRCRTCSRYYWPGSHWQNIHSTLERIKRNANQTRQTGGAHK